MSVTVKYKGSTIASMSNTTKTLETKGFYCEDDIEITETGGGGGGANLTHGSKSVTPSETAYSGTETPPSGYDGFDQFAVSVDAIPSNYVGSGVTRRSSSDLAASGDTVSVPSGYYENVASKAVPSGSVTAPANIVGTNADKYLGSGRLALQKVVDVTPNVTAAGYIDTGTQGQSTVLLASDITVRNARTFHPSQSDQTVDTNEYINGTQTFKAVTLTNLTAGNIKKDVVVKVGDSTDDDCVTSVTGTYEGAQPYFSVSKKAESRSTTLLFPVGDYTLPNKYVMFIDSDITEPDEENADLIHVTYIKATKEKRVGTGTYMRGVTTLNANGSESYYTSRSLTISKSGTNLSIKVASSYYRKDATYTLYVYDVASDI